jgi:hypothetical protein
MQIHKECCLTYLSLSEPWPQNRALQNIFSDELCI